MPMLFKQIIHEIINTWWSKIEWETIMKNEEKER